MRQIPGAQWPASLVYVVPMRDPASKNKVAKLGVAALSLDPKAEEVDLCWSRPGLHRESQVCQGYTARDSLLKRSQER